MEKTPKPRTRFKREPSNNDFKFVKIEHLVANAIVVASKKASKSNKSNPSEISIRSIEKYGEKVREELSSNWIRCAFLYSDEYMNRFLADYADYFEKEKDYIKVKRGKSPADINANVLSHADVDLLIALNNDICLETINLSNKRKK